MLTNKTILLISPEPWGTNYVSKHHYAVTLAERGNKVFFLNPPGQTNRVTEVKKNLWVVDYRATFRGLNRLPVTLRKALMKIDARKLRASIGKVDIVWSFDPYRFQNLKLFDNKLAIFHPVDVHANHKLVNETAARADIILATSDKILAGIRTQTPKFKINHGLAAAFTRQNFLLQPYTRKNRPLKIGYMGNLHYQYIDKTVLKQIVSEHPEIEFYFIGPYKESNLSDTPTNTDLVDFLNHRPNCYLLGPVPPEQLPQTLTQYDAFFMCYTGDRNLAALANPHKLLEYLATGKVVVAHYIDEYKDKRHLLEMVEDNTQLPQKFSEVINNLNHYNSPAKQQARQAWAWENTYGKQVEQIGRLLK